MNTHRKLLTSIILGFSMTQFSSAAQAGLFSIQIGYNSYGHHYSDHHSHRGYYYAPKIRHHNYSPYHHGHSYYYKPSKYYYGHGHGYGHGYGHSKYYKQKRHHRSRQYHR